MAPPLCRLHLVAGGDPVDRQVVIGIGEARSRLAGARTLALMAIGVPGRCGNAVELVTKRLEYRVSELAQKPCAEFALAQTGAWHAFAGL